MASGTQRSEPPAAQLRTLRTRDGTRLEYEIAGDGPPLVLLHGYFAGRRAFVRQVPAFARRFRVVVASARGHEHSDAAIPADYGAGSSDVDDLHELLDVERIERARLVAHSSGGATALVFAARHPDRVERMVLIEPTLIPLVPARGIDPDIAGMARAVAAEPETGALACMRAIVSVLGGAAWTRLDAAAQAARIEALARLAPLAAPHFRSLLNLQMTESDIRGLRPPSLFVYGAASYPFERAIAQVVARLRPDLPLHTLDGAGHNVHRDRAEDFNALALAFLDAQQAAG